ncbi:MAG: chloride channel protein [Atopobiaceae bacterium]|jgi:H+/Cl- antiporter ClcA|nr:chloride channel protein [Atopobiaceae bacterium]MCH4119688.1 chloride channel protein [Atopobiaceae bacterium]MCI1388762.1 chloride channel protein [Atopobiaceae bacterium]MCI1432618.1 chloride channel protein [Atopobiaceae bacterium]MCI1471045.1 chloride channel protein [Atopobiaceae bacterium]
MTDDAQQADRQAAGAPDMADAPNAQGAGTASRPRPQAHVIDAADERPHGVALAQVALALVACALVAGFVVGIGCLAALRGVDLLQELVWDRLALALPAPIRPFAPLALCMAGGFAIGLWTKHVGFRIDTLGVIVKHCRAEGGYEFRDMGEALVLFALPIAFGGAVGPEAGVSGIVCALATKAMRALRRQGVAAVSGTSRPLAAALAELLPASRGGSASANDRATALDAEVDWRYDRWPRRVLWGFGGLGFVGGIAFLARMLGPGGGLPRFEPIDYLHGSWLVGILAIACGIVLAGVAGATKKAASATLSGMGHVQRATICGICLGIVAIWLPDVLFSGQKATGTLISSWQGQGALVLGATCVLKLCLTQLCVEADWVGGEFFPFIYCGVCAGYVLALATGAEPMVPVACACGALVGAATSKPILSTCVLALCFPPASLPVVALAAYVGGKASVAILAKHARTP